MSTIRCNINGMDVSCESGATILDAAQSAGIDIPTLCHFQKLNPGGICRICVTEVEGMPRLMPACTTKVKDGMVIRTDSETVIQSRRETLDLICKRHRMDCEYCPDYTFCELHAVVRKLGLDDRKYSEVYHERRADESSKSIVRDNSKCIRCRRCVATCRAMGVEAIAPLYRAEETAMGAALPLAETDCIGCGQCVRNCPTGALFVKDDTDLLWRALNNKKKLVFGILPETAAGIGQFFGAKQEKNELGKLASVLKKCGAYKVYDLTGLHEAALNGITGEATICPAHVKPEVRHTEPLDKLFREKIKPVDDVFVVYVSGCTAYKREPHCDAVLTTTELFAFIQRACVSKFTTLDVWEKAQQTEAERLFPDGSIATDVLYACPGGCACGGGQFRAQGYQR